MGCPPAGFVAGSDTQLAITAIGLEHAVAPAAVGLKQAPVGLQGNKQLEDAGEVSRHEPSTSKGSMQELEETESSGRQSVSSRVKGETQEESALRGVLQVESVACGTKQLVELALCDKLQALVAITPAGASLIRNRMGVSNVIVPRFQGLPLRCNLVVKCNSAVSILEVQEHFLQRFGDDKVTAIVEEEIGVGIIDQLIQLSVVSDH
jgi:hypothetical protein